MDQDHISNLLRALAVADQNYIGISWVASYVEFDGGTRANMG